MTDLYISDVSLLLPDGSVALHQDVAVEQGVFKSIRPHGKPNAELPASSQPDEMPGGCQPKTFIKGSGKLLMPPLADCHMHTGHHAYDLDPDHAAL